MSAWGSALVGLAALTVIYAVFILALVLASRRDEARALASVVPDCLILIRRMIGDERVPRRRKLILIAAAGYLAFPIDLVPDFIPIAGQLDDVIVVALSVRYVLRSSGPKLVRELWPGPKLSLNALIRLAFGHLDEIAACTGP